MLLFPDIVTSLIGTMHFENPREGILFCLRDDVEAFYSKEEIKKLAGRFVNIRKDFTDTTIRVTPKEMARRREELILEKIRYFSTFRLVITDRYHGTIFSAIASTPVIVINSNDHKLSSGVAWFPKEQYGDSVQYASNLDEAYAKAEVILSLSDLRYENPPYFKENFWDKLKEQIEI